MKRPLVCGVCLEADGVESAAVVEHRCTNEHTGKDFTAHVCARCLKAGRETRVTCRSFTRRLLQKTPTRAGIVSVNDTFLRRAASP